MFKDKNRINSIVLSIFVFLFFIFHLGILRALLVEHFKIYFEINVLLMLFEFILSIFLSYKSYMVFRKRPFSVFKAGALTDFVIVILYFITSISFLFIASKIDFNLAKTNMAYNLLTLIIVLVLLYLAFITPLMVGYKFYNSLVDSDTHAKFEIERRNFFTGESRIRFGFIGGDRFNALLVSFIMLAIFFMMYYLDIFNFGGVFDLIFQATFLVFLVTIIVSSILRNYEFISSLLALALFILIFIFCLGLLGIYLIEFGSLILILSILLIPTFIYLLLVIIENKIWIEKK